MFITSSVVNENILLNIIQINDKFTLHCERVLKWFQYLMNREKWNAVCRVNYGCAIWCAGGVICDPWIRTRVAILRWARGSRQRARTVSGKQEGSQWQCLAGFMLLIAGEADGSSHSPFSPEIDTFGASPHIRKWHFLIAWVQNVAVVIWCVFGVGMWDQGRVLQDWPGTKSWTGLWVAAVILLGYVTIRNLYQIDIY